MISVLLMKSCFKNVTEVFFCGEDYVKTVYMFNDLDQISKLI